MAFLEITGLRKRFGSLEILKGIDIALDKGGFLVLVGPSGCGKSTFSIRSRGLNRSPPAKFASAARSINDLHPSKRDIAMVFQSYALYPNMSVAQNMAFGMEMRGVPKAERDKAVAARRENACRSSIYWIAVRASFPAASDSASRWVVHSLDSPSVFLFDEPLSNLDAKLRVDMRIEIKRLHQATGTTIVYVTHDQIEAMTLATKIAVLKDGELQQVGSPTKSITSPNKPLRRRLHGIACDEPARRQGDARQRRSEHRARATGSSADRPAVASERGRATTRRRRQGHLRHPARGGQRHAKAWTAMRRSVATFSANVEIVEPAGSDTFVVTHVAGKEVTARMRADDDVSGRPEPRIRLQSRQGGAVRPRDHAPNLSAKRADDGLATCDRAG